MQFHDYKKGWAIKFYNSDLVEKYPILADIVNFLLLPLSLIEKLSIYYSNAIVDKIHILETGFEKGVYYDLDTRLLYGCFNELVKYVENEYILKSYSDSKFIIETCISKLNEKINTTTNTTDKEAYIMLKELYIWWKITRNARKGNEFSFSCYQEDTEMLKKLISIRSILWY